MNLIRDDSRNRLRTPWRIIGILLVAYLLLFAGVILIQRLFRESFLPPHPPFTLAANGLLSVIVIGITLALATGLDRRDIHSYGFNLDSRWWGDLLAGCVVGLITASSAVAIGMGLGYAEVVEVVSGGEGGSLPLLVGLTIIGMGGIVIFEEVLFRGIVITNLLEGFSVTTLSESNSLLAAVLLSAFIFGPPHLIGGVSMGNESIAIAMVGYVAMGIVLGVAYVLTGELAFPIGLHFAYNLSNAMVFAPTEAFAEPYATVFRLDFALAGYFNSYTYDIVVVFVALLLISAWVYLSRGQNVVSDGLTTGGAK